MDVRVDDYAVFFEIKTNGNICLRDGAEKDRAAWNITLLKLDLPMCDKRREELLQLLNACEKLVEWIQDEPTHDHYRALLDHLLPELARRSLFLHVFGILISETLRIQIQAVVAAIRPPL
jgi:hypothetical protein